MFKAEKLRFVMQTKGPVRTLVSLTIKFNTLRHFSRLDHQSQNMLSRIFMYAAIKFNTFRLRRFLSLAHQSQNMHSRIIMYAAIKFNLIHCAVSQVWIINPRTCTHIYLCMQQSDLIHSDCTISQVWLSNPRTCTHI